MSLRFLLKKISQRGVSVLQEFRNLSSYYSFKFAFITLLWWLTYYLHWNKANKYFSSRKQKEINRIIETEFPEVVSKYKDREESTQKVKDFRIWVFWAQGEEKMPVLVKRCYCQFKNVEKENVFLITMENIREYVELPELLYKKLETGEMLYAHFSDILRNTLIAKYGGVWYDATCWITSSFPENFKGYPYFSPKNHKDGTTGVVYALGSGLKESVTFRFVRDILLGMLESGKQWPDYLFQDYVFNYAKKYISATRKALEILPDNNTERFLLFSWMNQPFDENKYKDLIKNNWIFKLSYKAHYEEYHNGKPTFYYRLILGKND